MADFYTTRGISFVIDELIKSSEESVYLVTPYLKFSNTIFERITDAIKRGVNITFVYGKTELYPEQYNLLTSLKCNIYFKENLHAKCYINENDAIVSSMNLHSFSEVNNIEMGMKINKKKDRVAYEDCKQEIQNLIQNSKPIKSVDKIEKTKTEPTYDYDEFLKVWYQKLKSEYSDLIFNLEDRVFCSTQFPFKDFKLTNQYGFVSVEFDLPKEEAKDFRNKLRDMVYDKLENYRCYWNHPYNRISLYHATDIEFSNLNDDVDYCFKGLNILLDTIENEVVEYNNY